MLPSPLELAVVLAGAHLDHGLQPGFGFDFDVTATATVPGVVEVPRMRVRDTATGEHPISVVERRDGNQSGGRGG